MSAPGGELGHGDGEGVFARRFGADVAPLFAETQVNAFTAGAQRTPAVAGDADGGFVVVWESQASSAPGPGSSPAASTPTVSP